MTIVIKKYLRQRSLCLSTANPSKSDKPKPICTANWSPQHSSHVFHPALHPLRRPLCADVPGGGRHLTMRVSATADAFERRMHTTFAGSVAWSSSRSRERHLGACPSRGPRRELCRHAQLNRQGRNQEAGSHQRAFHLWTIFRKALRCRPTHYSRARLRGQPPDKQTSMYCSPQR